MIAYLQGTIHKKFAKSLVINTGNVGYQVFVANPLFEKTEEKQDIELYIYTKVREDDISLYGFETFSELEFFKLLLNVNGIGPKLALEILCSNPEKTKMAIVTGDINFLSKIPGIGKKTAERLIVELKNKITPENINIEQQKTSLQLEGKTLEEAIAALQNLGYQRFEITRIFKNLPEDITSSEAMVTYFLQNI